MTSIKPIAPKRCPECEVAGSLYLSTDRKLACRMCGYKKRPAPVNHVEEPVIDRRSQWQVTYGTPNSSDVQRWAMVKYTSGLDYTRQGQYDDALRAFEQAIEMQRDFVDAHLWIARLTLDPKEKHQHYSEVIAYMPMNLEAQRELMVLNRQMTREEADRATDMSARRDIQDLDIPIDVTMIEIKCSQCGGTLEGRSDRSHVSCKFCGNNEPLPEQKQRGTELLSMAMLKDRGQGTTWRVGSYVLHCDNCGSERIITSKKMNIECPFCGSNHILKADALQTFRQPDGILPFKVSREDAAQCTGRILESFSERVKSFFITNKPKEIKLVSAYLPFWYFDVTAQITITQVQRGGARSYLELNAQRSQESLVDGLNNVPYCAVESPSHRLTDRLKAYELGSLESYNPKLLAGHTAEIYTIDYQQASINVRNEIGERFRYRHGHDPHGNPQTSVRYLIQQMAFRLIMVPVWVVNITEVDGDLRLGLVHGQTGQIILGNATRLPK